MPVLNRIGSGWQTWVAVAVTRPALSALALLAFALFAGDDLPGLLAELAPPLGNGLGLVLMPAVAAAAALPPPALRWHVQHADTARAGRGGQDHAPRALPRPGRPLARSRRHRASHGGARRSGRHGSRAHPDSRRPRHQSFMPAGFRGRVLSCRRHPLQARGDERMSMARKALREVGEAVTKIKMPSTGRPAAPGSGRQAAASDPGRSRADRRPRQ